MSKQTKASEHWAHTTHLASIQRLREQALNPMYPAGQTQAGIQLASVEVPWLLAEIEKLKEQINGRSEKSAQGVAS